MTDKQKIKKLETDIVELKMKVAMLEARPMIITLPSIPALPAPSPLPYVGDGPPYGTTICQSNQINQNTMGKAVMSSQSSSFVQ